MKKATPYLIIIFLLFVTVQTFVGYLQEVKQRERITEAWKASSKTLGYYHTKSGKMAAKASAMEMNLQEVKKIMPEIINQIQDMKITPRQTELYSSTATVTEKRILTILRDSIIFDTVKHKIFSYSDPWNQVKGQISGDTIKLGITTFDTITSVISRGKRIRPWLWIFSRRQLENTTTNANPSAKVTYQKTIKFTDK